MEIQLQELIEKIKQDGVKSAEEERASILAAANTEAEQILAAAKAEADQLLQAAKEENARLQRSAEESIRQAGRNLLLSFRESVRRELRAVTGEAVSAAYSPEVLIALLPQIVETWAKHPETEDVAVLLPEKELAAMEDALLAALKARMLSGVTLRPDGSLDGGFRISVNGGSAYYDYSAEAVVDMLASYLSPRVTALLKEAGNV